MANSSNISLRLNVENGDYMIVWGMYDVKHSGSEVSNCWLYLLITWGYLIYKTGWITAQKCDVSICRQYFGMSGVRPWAWPRDGILSRAFVDVNPWRSCWTKIELRLIWSTTGASTYYLGAQAKLLFVDWKKYTRTLSLFSWYKYICQSHRGLHSRFTAKFSLDR